MEMQEKRRNKRFKINAANIQGKMVLANKVDIVDISLDGVALQADRRLDIGRVYPIQLTYGGESINVKGVVVRSSLSGSKMIGGKDSVPIYSAGLIFKESTTEKIALFLNAVELANTEELPTANDRRRNIRFRIITHGNAVLSFPIHYKVIEISLAGMLIQTEKALEIESLVPMELSLHEGETSTFEGRIASCRKGDGTEGTRHEIGVEFLQIRDEDKKVLTSFIGYLTATEGNAPGK